MPPGRRKPKAAAATGGNAIRNNELMEVPPAKNPGHRRQGCIRAAIAARVTPTRGQTASGGILGIGDASPASFGKYQIAKRESISTTNIFHSAQIRPTTVPEPRSRGFLAFIFRAGLAVWLLAGAASLPGAPIRPPENSDIVTKGSDGVHGVMKKDGTPINGLKLSQHDQLVLNPNIAVTADGAIHVAFIERQVVSPYTLFVYHRKSSDGGKTWSEAKNLSEEMVNCAVGYCNLLVDGQDRVYVIWRAGLGTYLPVSEGQNVNLVYRVLDHGKWSKIIAINAPGSASTQNNASIFSFASTDAAGHVQVVWNACPDTFRPELTVNGMHLAGVGNGLVFQATLDGSTPPTPRQIYMAQVTANASMGDTARCAMTSATLMDTQMPPGLRILSRSRAPFAATRAGRRLTCLKVENARQPSNFQPTT